MSKFLINVIIYTFLKWALQHYKVTILKSILYEMRNSQVLKSKNIFYEMGYFQERVLKIFILRNGPNSVMCFQNL